MDSDPEDSDEKLVAALDVPVQRWIGKGIRRKKED